MENFEIHRYTDQLQSYALYLLGALLKMNWRYEDVGKEIGLSRQTLSLYHKDPSRFTIRQVQTLERVLKKVKQEL